MNITLGNDSTLQYLLKPILNDSYGTVFGGWPQYSDTKIHVDDTTITATGTDNIDVIDILDFLNTPFREHLVIRAMGGNDWIDAHSVANNNIINKITAYGGDGDDIYYASDAHNNFDGGIGIDTVSYAKANNQVRVNLNTGEVFKSPSDPNGTYQDKISNVEYVVASQYDDEVIGNTQNNFIEGKGGRDKLNGGAGSDTVSGGDHNDTIEGGDGDDHLYGDQSDDIVFGGTGNDAVYGGLGDDVLVGDSGNDRLDGGNGDDSLYGGAGDDTFIGGLGDDVMFSGAPDGQEASDGSDLYVFNLTNAGCGVDEIFGFQDGVDKLKFGGIVDSIGDLTISSQGSWAVIHIDGLDADTNVIAIEGASGLIDASDFIFG